MNKLIAILALGTVYYFVQAKEFLKDFTVKFLDAKIDLPKTRDSGFSKVYFILRIRVANKTDFKGVVESGYIILSYQGKRVGDSVSNEAFEIEPRQEMEIKIPVTIDSVRLVGSIPAMFQMLTVTRQIKFHVDGILKFKIGDYKINQDYTVKL